MTEEQPYRVAPEEPMKIEMNDNAMYAAIWKRALTAIAATIILVEVVSHALSWHEANLAAEATRLKTTPLGLKIAEAERDKAMFEHSPVPKP